MRISRALFRALKARYTAHVGYQQSAVYKHNTIGHVHAPSNQIDTAGPVIVIYNLHRIDIQVGREPANRLPLGLTAIQRALGSTYA